ncbi:MAG: ATP-binding protein [bacterium]
MTLKTRLAAMMILLLVAVVALQALLTQRERRAVDDRLGELRDRVDVSTRALSDHTREWLSRGPPQFFPGDSSQVEMVLVVAAGDSTRERRRFLRGEVPTDVEALLAELEQDAERVGQTRELIWNHDVRVVRGDSALATLQEHRFTAASNDTGDVEVLFRAFGDSALAGDGDDGLRVHVSVPGRRASTLELVFPVSDVTRELERGRRRSWLWLAGLLGVGATGAVAVAVQFTRPIRELERSFGEVEAGNLDVHVAPRREDEIGGLTRSFNAMVVRLRESRRLETRLAESERLASVGRMAAGVAHEVRNPLNAMRLTLEQLRVKNAPPAGEERERFDRYVDVVQGELGRLERLVSAFLEYSHAGEIAREQVDVAATVRGTVDVFASEATARGVTLSCDTEAAMVVGDPERLRNVWNNLVSNALHATSPGGRVDVRVERGDAIRVIVADDGVGIPEADQARVFEPFWSGRPDGTGLGLALARAIVEAHDGRIELASGPGRGTTFTVILPEAP